MAGSAFLVMSMKSGAPASVSGSGPFDRGRHLFRPRRIKLEFENANRGERHRALLAFHRERCAGTEILQRLPSQEQRKALLNALHRKPR